MSGRNGTRGGGGSSGVRVDAAPAEALGEKERDELPMATVRVPLMQTKLYATRRVDGALSQADAFLCRQIQDGIEATTQSRCKGPMDVLKWMLKEVRENSK